MASPSHLNFASRLVPQDLRSSSLQCLLHPPSSILIPSFSTSSSDSEALPLRRPPHRSIDVLTARRLIRHGSQMFPSLHERRPSSRYYFYLDKVGVRRSTMSPLLLQSTMTEAGDHSQVPIHPYERVSALLRLQRPISLPCHLLTRFGDPRSIIAQYLPIAGIEDRH